MTDQVSDATSGESFVNLVIEDRIAWVTLARPPVNALSLAVLEELALMIARLSEDPAVAALVLRGAGRGFAGGGDIEELRRVPSNQVGDYSRRVQNAVQTLASCPMPTVAAVHGFAMGGGTELALACDIRVAAEGALFGLPETKLGLIPGLGGTARLPDVIGRSRAKAMVMSGRTMNAQDALAIGLVDGVVLPEALVDEARRRAGWFTSPSAAAMRVAKELIDGPVGDAQEREAAAFAELLAGEDAAIGLASFLKHGVTGRAHFPTGTPHRPAASPGGAHTLGE